MTSDDIDFDVENFAMKTLYSKVVQCLEDACIIATERECYGILAILKTALNGVMAMGVHYNITGQEQIGWKDD